MNVLHTADWHLGKTLYGRKRYDEFQAFLDWLVACIAQQKIDVLLIAGDIFDSSMPGNRSQELYYQFLNQAATSGCRHIVIIAGNHDSPSFISAPKSLLRAMNIHVVGSITDNIEDEVIVLHDQKNKPEAIVCAVPYLRDKDIRTTEADETEQDKNIKLIKNIKNHYDRVCAHAVKIQSENDGVPIIAMGHLFTTGGKTIEGDGVRELYIGSLAYISSHAFPACIDYLALGHLHIPQIVGGNETMRYSGSPIPIGFGEAMHQKKIVIFECAQKIHNIREQPVPCFQMLRKATGTTEQILNQIENFKTIDSPIWLEIEYTDSEPVDNLREKIEKAVEGTQIEILRIKNNQTLNVSIHTYHDDDPMDALNTEVIFERCLDRYDIPPHERPEMVNLYRNILQNLLEEDANFE